MCIYFVLYEVQTSVFSKPSAQCELRERAMHKVEAPRERSHQQELLRNMIECSGGSALVTVRTT